MFLPRLGDSGTPHGNLFACILSLCLSPYQSTEGTSDPGESSGATRHMPQPLKLPPLHAACHARLGVWEVEVRI